jgi:hypothetical protein
MLRKKLPAIFEKGQGLSNLASYLIIVSMMVCIAYTFSELARWMTYQTSASLSYSYQWGFLPLLVIFTSIEAIFTLPVVAELEGREKILYLAAEWITFAILVKLVIYAIHGFDLLILDLPRWRANFIAFFEGEFFYAYLLIAFTWMLSRSAAKNIKELNVETTDFSWELGKLQNNRTLIRSNLISRTLWVGILMVFVTAMIRVTMASSPEAANVRVPIVSVVVYFFLALALFSQTQYALLKGNWFWNETPMSSLLTNAWLRYSLILFGAIAIISFVLPTNYSMGLLETLNLGFGFLINLVFTILQLILLPLIWLLSLAGCTPQNKQNTEQSTPVPPQAPQVPSAPIPWLELLQSIFFWAIFVGVISYALVQFIRQNPQLMRFLGRQRGFQWLNAIWRWIGNIFRKAGAQAAVAFQQVRSRLISNRKGDGLRQVRRWTNFRQLNPRQQIIFFYLRLIERGGENGIQRKSYETPNQYAETLQSNLPEVEEDIEGITEKFLEARYSAHPVDPQTTSLVQRFWRNITHSLERFRVHTQDKKP